MKNKSIFKIKDSVDLFLSNEKFLMVYYMNTRQRKSFKINSNLIYLIENINGENTLKDLCDIMQKYGISADEVNKTISLLQTNKIVTEVKDINEILDYDDRKRYDRQINYFSEFFGNEVEGHIAQKRIIDSTVLIFGCGAVGSAIAIELAMAGVGSMVLYDYDLIEESDVARHLFYSQEYVGNKKVEALRDELTRINSKITVTTKNDYLNPDTQVEELIKSVNFVVNTLDEPYIGYTSSKISRICVKYNIPHYIAGGFDAHLASTGELIIPYLTPCVECYARYFKKTLKDWKPEKHPVTTRYKEIGGLSCLSLFSASYACIEIIKWLAGLIDMKSKYKTRGEFLFTDMSLTYLNVEKNPDCLICGGKDFE